MEKPIRTVKAKFLFAEKGSKAKGFLVALGAGIGTAIFTTQVLKDDTDDEPPESKEY